MPSPEKQVRVFISSTFRDMHAERDHLVTIVFPELRERIELLGLEFFDVDLRWGVPEKNADGETANSWEYCRQWIDRVEPLFVCILGQRYGWVPEVKDFKDEADQSKQKLEPRSITDLEVRHAVLDSQRKRRSYFYLRATDAPADASEYVDPKPLLEKLVKLKSEVRVCGRPVRDFHPAWTGERFTGMDEFGCLVLEDLWSGVLRDERYVSKDAWRQALDSAPETDPRYTDESQPVPRALWEKIVALAKPVPKDPLEVEREQMDAFAASRLRWFQGRASELKQLTDFIDAAGNTSRIAVVAAMPGQGKSALLARLHEELKSSSDYVITHFVGATERSASSYALVEKLLLELDRSGIEWPADEQKAGEEPKRDFNSLCHRLAKRLGEYAGERDIVIIIDALNQLSDGRDLTWLPYRLGPSVCVIISCFDDAANADSPDQRVFKALTSRQPAPLRVPLGPLTKDDVRTIVVAYFKEYCKELDREHVDAICRMEQARNPLYLLVLLGELRTLGGNDLNRIVPELIASMPQNHPDTVSLFRWVLQRLEVFGAEAVRWWSLYLAHGRVGMASHELADLLARKLDANAAATALLIERGLRRYLLRRSGQLDFFHGQLRLAVLEQYGPHVEVATVHSNIAIYFHAQNTFLESIEEQRARARQLPITPRPANKRKVEELVYQRLSVLNVTPAATPEFANACEKLEKLLTDIFFLEAKAEAGMIFELASDFAAVVKRLPMERPRHRILLLLGEALQRDGYFIARHPTTLFQCMWNACWWYDCPSVPTHYDGSEGHWNHSGEMLHQVLENWHTARVPSLWMRSLRPPQLPLGTARWPLVKLASGRTIR